MSEAKLPPIPAPKIDEEDTPVFPGGPYMSEIETWKQQYTETYMTEVGVDVFIWRPLNRYEYKHIVTQLNTNELMREEMICQQCVLWPKDYSLEDMVNAKAGIPSLLAEQIMRASGFIPNSDPIML